MRGCCIYNSARHGPPGKQNAEIPWPQLFGIAISAWRRDLLRFAHDDDVTGAGRQLVGNLWEGSGSELLCADDFNGARRDIVAGILSARLLADVEMVACRNDSNHRRGLGCCV